jgi:hypothetical protein
MSISKEHPPSSKHCVRHDEAAIQKAQHVADLSRGRRKFVLPSPTMSLAAGLGVEGL